MEGAPRGARPPGARPITAGGAKRAERIVQHPHPHPGPRALGEGGREAPTGRVIADDVVLEVDRLARGGDRPEHDREGTRAVGVMLEAVPADRPGPRPPAGCPPGRGPPARAPPPPPPAPPRPHPPRP